MRVHGVPVRGFVHDCHQPFVFNSKTRLHATEPWTGARRLTLVAWSTLTFDVKSLGRIWDSPSLPALRPNHLRNLALRLPSVNRPRVSQNRTPAPVVLLFSMFLQAPALTPQEHPCTRTYAQAPHIRLQAPLNLPNNQAPSLRRSRMTEVSATTPTAPFNS